MQKHNIMLYNDILLLFIHYNKLIANVIANIDKRHLQNKWEIEWIDKSPCVTLENLITHYNEHLKGHLDHFRERLNELKKTP